MDFKTIIYLLFIGWLTGAATCLVIVIIVDRLKKKPEPAKNDWADEMRKSSYEDCIAMLKLKKAMVESENIKLEKENKKLKDQVELLKATLDVYEEGYPTWNGYLQVAKEGDYFTDFINQFPLFYVYDEELIEKIDWIWKFDRIAISMKDGLVVSIFKPESGFLLKNEFSPEVWEKLTELTKIKEDGSAKGK